MKLTLAILTLPLLVPAQAKSIAWSADFAAALSQATEESKPVFIGVNMDGERANDDFAKNVYTDKSIVKLSERTVNLIASVFDHKTKGECSRFGTITCADHKQVDIKVRSQVLKPDLDGYVIAPQHVFLDAAGKAILSVPYQITRQELEWCFVTAILTVDPDADVRMPQGAHPPKRLVMNGVASTGDAESGGAGTPGGGANSGASGSPLPREDMVELISEIKKGSLKGEDLAAGLRRLMTADEPEAVEFIVKALRGGGGRNAGDPRERQRELVGQIGRLSPPRFWEAVAEFADSTDEGLRNASAATLEQLSAPDSIKVIQKAFKKEKEPNLKSAWLRALASSDPADKKIRGTVLKAARKNSDTTVQVGALVAAGYLSPGEDRDEVLAAAFAAEDLELRRAAACGMAISRDSKWLRGLRDAAKVEVDTDAKEAYTAAAAVLGRGTLNPLCSPLMKVCGDDIPRERFYGSPR